MKYYDWNPDKNEKLVKERNVSFENVVWHIENGDLVADVKHPNTKKYNNQRMIIVNIDNYIYIVPYVETATGVFLKTIISSRKLTKKYLKGEL